MSRVSALVVLLIYILYFVYELKTYPLRSDADSIAGFDIESRPGTAAESQHLVPSYTSSPRILPPRTIRFADEDTERFVGGMAYKAPNPVELGTAASELSDYQDDLESRGRRSQDVRGEPSGRPTSYQPYPRGHSRSLSLGSSRRPLSRASSISGLSRQGPIRPGLTAALQILQRRTSMESEAPEQQPPPPRSRYTDATVVAVVVLAITSALMSVSAELLVGTIDDITHQGHLSESVIGLIILPIVGNIAEYVTVVTVAARDKLDLAIAVAVGSSIQIALCVAPLTVIAGWILNRELSLTFNLFETGALLGTAVLVSLLVFNDGGSALRASGLKGALMCACYAIIG